MSARVLSLCGGLAAAFVAGCKDSSPVPHTPTHMVIVSGAGQSGDLAKALDSALVVRVLDGAEKPVAGVPLAWTVTGGGSVSAASTVTDNDGRATVTWTLAPTTGVQAVTVTSPQIVGGSVSFLATNGATITGTITPAGGLPFGASFSRAPASSARFGAAAARPAHVLRPSRIIVGFRGEMMGLAAAGSGAYRTISTARQASTRLQQQVAALTASRGLRNAQVSPALLAARMDVDDSTQIESTMAALRADPSVAWVERDAVISIHDGAPRPMSAEVFSRGMIGATAGASTAASKLPNDPGFWEQLWPSAMLDLPKAWTVTTGSRDVTVAVVDMGIRFDHADIAANLTSDGYDFVTPFTFKPEKNCDGSTFTTTEGDGTGGPDSDPTDPDDIEFEDTAGCWFHNTLGDHGLWTAGIIGAVGNEGVGVAGVNWNVRIRPVRVLDITGGGSTFDIAQGVLYAAGLPAAGANGTLVQAPSRAQIINLSLGGSGRSTTLENAVNAAYTAGSLIVASAGNDGLDIATYPAAYTSVMGVAAVGQDGALATYSNGGTFVSVAAPGGDFRFDDNGGGAVLGPAWDFLNNRATYVLGYGTSAAAPYVSGIAALLLAQTPSLTPAQLRQRIETYATRPAGVTRSDALGWGIVNAYNSLTQTNGPARQTIVRLVDATTGLSARTTTAANGTFAFTRLPQGSYYVQAGDDEAGDGLIGIPGRRFGWAGGFGAPSVFNVNANAQAASIVLGVPTEVEPNDDAAHANLLAVGGYVVGNITTPDVRDMYSVTIPAPGTYTFETSGVTGTCGLGIELDTFLSVASAAGVVAGSNNDFTSVTSRYCSRVSVALTTGVYFVTVTGSSANRLSSRGRYRLEVRSGS